MKNESLPDAVGAAPFTLQSLSLAFKHLPAYWTAAHKQPRPSKSETLDIMILGNQCQAMSDEFGELGLGRSLAALTENHNRQAKWIMIPTGSFRAKYRLNSCWFGSP